MKNIYIEQMETTAMIHYFTFID